MTAPISKLTPNTRTEQRQAVAVAMQFVPDDELRGVLACLFAKPNPIHLRAPQPNRNPAPGRREWVGRVRAWCRSTGIQLANHAYVPKKIQAQYEKATGDVWIGPAYIECNTQGADR